MHDADSLSLAHIGVTLHQAWQMLLRVNGESHDGSACGLL